jgi:hypothetical protein
MEIISQLDRLVKNLKSDLDVMVNNMGTELAISHVFAKLDRFQELLSSYPDSFLNDLENEYKAGYEAGRRSVVGDE